MEEDFPLFTLSHCQLENKKDNPKASVLILSLWTVVLLSLFSITLSYGLRQKVSLVQKLEEKRKFSGLLEAGIMKAISYLKNEAKRDYLGLNDRLINNPIDFKDMDFGEGILVSLAYSFSDDAGGEIYTFYGFVDESRKININKTEPSILKNLFIQLGLDAVRADEVATSIVDWRDADDLLSGPNSVEGTYYPFPETSYPIKNSDFEILEELLLVKGMDKDLFDRAKDYLTIYGDGRVNINTASGIVLSALGLEPTLVDKIIDFRAGKDKISGTDDDNVFLNTEEIAGRLDSVFGLSNLELEQLDRIRGYLRVDTDFFKVNCTSYRKEAKYKKTATAIVDKQGDIFFWQES